MPPRSPFRGEPPVRSVINWTLPAVWLLGSAHSLRARRFLSNGAPSLIGSLCSKLSPGLPETFSELHCRMRLFLPKWPFFCLPFYRCPTSTGAWRFFLITHVLFPLYSSVLVCRTALTKYYRLGGLYKRISFFHSSRGYKSKIKILAGLVSSQVSLLGL